MTKNYNIILPGGAGLVGQNLVIALKKSGYTNITVLDKHVANLNIMKQIHPDITIEYADLANKGDWQKYFTKGDVVIMLQAQIGDLNYEPFVRNNITSTKNILAAIKQYKVPYLIHISSSVVNSIVDDHYVKSKTEQEQLVTQSKVKHVILRPTLMFGWFDRKHLGWLARFMQKTPFFPIPNHGKYIRQPLYVKDFCNIIISCMENKISGKTFNITGLRRIYYIDIIKEIKQAVKAKTIIIKIPYIVFFCLLKLWAIFDKSTPFTTDQLKALVAPEEFEVIDWPKIFNVKPTNFSDAIAESFNDPNYSKIKLDF